MVDNLRTGSILLPTGVFLIFMKTGACHHFSPQGMTRRSFLQGTACGFGSLALSALTAQEMSVTGSAHFPARAKRVIFLFLHGGVSQVDSFDHKPRLAAEHGRPLPFKPLANLDATKDGKVGQIFASPWKFRRAGQSGNWVSDLWPHLGKQIDELCFIKSMETLGTSHGQAVSMLHTGTDSLVRPSLGAWASYGLGSENASLPGFISIAPPRGHGGPRNFGSAFLPAQHGGTAIGHANMDAGKEAHIRYLERPVDGDRLRQRELGFLQELNAAHLERSGGRDAQIEGVIASYEMAFRMQGVAPDLLNLSDEPNHIRSLYGLEETHTAEFGRRCLLARRFCEAGVRFVQVSTPYVWDQHSGLKEGHAKNAAAVDRPIAGMLTDLKQRGMLEDTLVVWATEFGRTPIAQGSNGRDHNPAGFTIWLAGAGVKAGHSHGSTDDYGYYAEQDKVHLHDLHATLLHLIGLDHERLTYRYGGRDFRLTDVFGQVVREVLS